MSEPAVLDPRPIDYRSAQLCSVLLAKDVRAALGAVAGDVLRISTERQRSVLCRLADSADEPGAGALRIDRFARQALKAYPHERVTLEVATPEPTAELALLPGIDLSQHFDPHLVPALKRLLAAQRVAVRPGMMLYLRPDDGLAGVTYDVHFVAGEEGVVTPDTVIWLISDDHDHGPEDHEHDHDRKSETVVDTTFEDVGGLSAQIREVRELVQLPLKFPHVYQQLGITPPRGIILYGAPGTGKTRIARASPTRSNAQLLLHQRPGHHRHLLRARPRQPAPHLRRSRPSRAVDHLHRRARRDRAEARRRPAPRRHPRR